MSQDNIVTFCATSPRGIRYNVYHKDDTKRENIMYMGLIANDKKDDECTCTGFTLLHKCYHNKLARSVL